MLLILVLHNICLNRHLAEIWTSVFNFGLSSLCTPSRGKEDRIQTMSCNLQDMESFKVFNVWPVGQILPIKAFNPVYGRKCLPWQIIFFFSFLSFCIALYICLTVSLLLSYDIISYDILSLSYHMISLLFHFCHFRIV